IQTRRKIIDPSYEPHNEKYNDGTTRSSGRCLIMIGFTFIDDRDSQTQWTILSKDSAIGLCLNLQEVFPNDLPGVPRAGEIDVGIDLLLDIAYIYLMANDSS
ncbi:hypothetical protein HAX54_026044, partial [Datura stramonium]|nr:hypothetical protein [Datura stramonium]